MKRTMTDRVDKFIEIAETECRMVFDNQKLLDWLGDNGYFSAPASSKYHGAYPGGLYDHSEAVYNRLAELTFKLDLQWDRPESPFIVGFFHDLCKCDQYIERKGVVLLDASDNGVELYGEGIKSYEHNDKLLLKGHGDKSVMLLSQFMSLTEEEMLCIRYHMGAYQTDDWPQFDLAIRRHENVLWCHQADQLASKVDNI